MKLAEQSAQTKYNHTKTIDRHQHADRRLETRDWRGRRTKETRDHEHQHLYFERDSQSLSVSSAQTQHQVESRFLLNVVVGQGPSVLQLLARKDQALLLGRDALLVLDLGLHVLDRVVGLHVQRDGLARERLDKDLHRATAQAQHQVERRLLLDVVVAQRAAVLQLLARKDQALLLG